MKDLFRLGTLCAAATLFASLSHASAVTTFSTYTFTGECGDCTGQGTGTLVLKNYTPGDELETSNFVSFTYSSNLLKITGDSLDLDDAGSLSGMLPVDLPGAANVDIDALVVVPGCEECTQYVFESATFNDAQWSVGEYDYGTSGVWSAAAQKTAVPEPSSLPMLGVGLAGLSTAAVRARLRGLFTGKRTT